MKTRFYLFNIKKIVLFAVFFVTVQGIYADNLFEEGKMFLKENRLDKAAKFFFAASKKPGTPLSVNLYLGITYFRLGNYNDALKYFSNGRKTDSSNLYLYSYNIGNIYFLQSRFTAAEQAYNDAVSINGLYAPAFLNRANVRVHLSKYKDALQDYKIYLNLVPETGQKEAIINMIAVLEKTAEEEAGKKEAAFAAARAAAIEEAKAAAIAEAKAAALAVTEEQRREAEERYQKMLDDVNSNLSSVDDADSLSAGADGTLDYTEENELD